MSFLKFSVTKEFTFTELYIIEAMTEIPMKLQLIKICLIGTLLICPKLCMSQSKYNTDSLKYAIVQGGENTAQTQYFSINPNTGAITLRQRIANDGSTSYVVSLLDTVEPPF